MKLKNTQALTSFRYGWLLKRVFPYIKPVLGRVILGFLIAIPVGLLDGVVSFSLKPYMDYVVGKQNLILWGFEIQYSVIAIAMPFAIIGFAVFQGVLRYINSYLTDWTSFKITNSVKCDLFARLMYILFLMKIIRELLSTDILTIQILHQEVLLIKLKLLLLAYLVLFLLLWLWYTVHGNLHWSV